MSIFVIIRSTSFTCSVCSTGRERKDGCVVLKIQETNDLNHKYMHIFEGKKVFSGIDGFCWTSKVKQMLK